MAAVATLKDSGRPVDPLALLGAAEARALRAGPLAREAEPPQLVHSLFATLAAEKPAAVAACFRDQRLTYGELDERSSRLAHCLLARGVGPGIPVAVCVRPSLDVLVAMWAIWKARGIYFPLDPTHPEALIGRMLDEAQPPLALTTSALARLTAPFPQLLLDADASVLEGRPKTAPALEPTLADPAYLFYTSGTTGKPKGVVATQGNLAFYVRSAAQKYGFDEADVFVSLARYTFSISLFELVSPLCCGGSVRILDRDDVLAPDRLWRALEDVTVLHAGPSLLDILFRHQRATPSVPRSLPRMRHASSGGDMVSPSTMVEMKRVFSNAELFVIYGCTEVSCMGTTFPIRRDENVSRTLVGKPFPGVQLRVVDSNRNLVPVGGVGEICFAGKGVVRGYFQRPELTAEKFLEIEGHRFYQTGDMGRLLPDGNLEILGRRDFQVQLRGIRIELTGIEQMVQTLGLAARCAVVAKTLKDGDVRLVAYVVDSRDPRVTFFRRALATELPDYMLPHHIVVLDAMPLTVNGKLDRARLKDLPLELLVDSEPPATLPANEREERLAEVFAGVLGRSKVGVEDNFFDLGGDSLLGVVLLEEIRRAIGIALKPNVLFESGSVRGLAAQTELGNCGEPTPVALGVRPKGPALFMLSGVHTYRSLAQHLGDRCSPYGVFTRREVGGLDSADAVYSVEQAACDCVKIIRGQQPSGPYHLLGYSFGGLVAYETAQQLRAAGEEVRFLALLDAALPEWTTGWRFRVAQVARLRTASPRDVAVFAWRRLRGRPSLADLMRFNEDAKRGPLEEQREAVHREAAAQYMGRIRPYAGAVTLIVAGDRLRQDPLKSPSCGWSAYVRALDVETIDADHFRMMAEPYASEVAGMLSARIEQAALHAQGVRFRPGHPL